MRISKLNALHIPIEPALPVPLFLQIVEGMVAAIRDGKLAPGAPLPGRRELSERLNVSHTTVVAAYGELLAQGWVEMRERSGTYVVERLPQGMTEGLKASTTSLGQMNFDLPTRTDLVTSQMARVTKLSQGLPDPRLLPKSELGWAYRTALLGTEAPAVASPAGHPELRMALSRFLAERRGITSEPNSVLVTRGNRMALNLLAHRLLHPGDLVAVENPGNPTAWECFREVKAKIEGIPVDGEGLDVDALENLVRTLSIRLVYLSPRFQFPTTVNLSQERRKRLIELAQTYGFIIVEEDSEADYAPEEHAVRPLAAHRDSCEIVYLYSFSRLLAPGVRMGMLNASPKLVKDLTEASEHMDWDGDPVMEQAVAALLTSGEIHRHIHRVTKAYQTRRDVTVACLLELFERGLDLDVPEGGLSLWVRVDPALDLEFWSRRCVEQGIHFQTGRDFTLDRKALPAFRLGYAAFDPGEMADILVQMRHTFPAS